MKLPSRYMARIPSEYKKEYIDTVCGENFSRMLVIAVLLVVIEPLIAIFAEPPKTASFYLALCIALFALAYIPILLYFKKNIIEKKEASIMVTQTFFIIGILSGAIAWSLEEQTRLASGSTFFLGIFTVAAFILMPPFISAILFLAASIAFVTLLPLFQADPDIITTLDINILSVSVVAWILNQMASRSEVKSFMDEKTIIEKNAELEKKNVELNELTMRDSMTNLINHKNSMRRLKEEVDRAKRIGYSLTVAMIDLDNFKLINDTYGHQTGDEVLIRVAMILQESCRSTDIVGRYGGEEFILIMPDTNDRDAVLLLERVQTTIRETSFKEGIQITLSCGVSELNGESVHGILRTSDIMLYQAKKKGKNRVEVNNNNEKKSAEVN